MADYGQGRIVLHGEIETAGMTLDSGTAGYSAPETISASSHGTVGMYTAKCDVWSLGVIAYMCCSGIPPFPLNNPHKARQLTLGGKFKPMNGPKSHQNWTFVPEVDLDLR